MYPAIASVGRNERNLVDHNVLHGCETTSVVFALKPAWSQNHLAKRTSIVETRTHPRTLASLGSYPICLLQRQAALNVMYLHGEHTSSVATRLLHPTVYHDQWTIKAIILPSMTTVIVMVTKDQKQWQFSPPTLVSAAAKSCSLHTLPGNQTNKSIQHKHLLSAHHSPTNTYSTCTLPTHINQNYNRFATITMLSSSAGMMKKINTITIAASGL